MKISATCYTQTLLRTQNVLATKKQTEKHNKWHSFKNICSSKHYYKSKATKHRLGDNIFNRHKWQKILFWIYQQLLNLKKERKTITNWQKIWTKIIQNKMRSKYTQESHSISFIIRKILIKITYIYFHSH